MLKKDEKISELEIYLQDSRKDMGVLRGLLPKAFHERDLMREEVKQYSEKNVLLDSKVSMLKKKIDVLDKDILFKDGQVTILKDFFLERSFATVKQP
ncbi:hypothetical protein NL676_029449 [Syzygium grande]|nr:hypothetical protein NL676_029449 [Syzygium grande]